MPLYDVLQVLVRHRTVRVEATSKAEAEELAQAGHGELIHQDRRYRLLAAQAEPAEVQR